MERSRCEGTNFTDIGRDDNMELEQRKNSKGKEFMLQNRTRRDEQERYTTVYILEVRAWIYFKIDHRSSSSIPRKTISEYRA